MIPNDPVIFLSFVNTKLRDEYSSLCDLCDDLCEDEMVILKKLAEIGYKYDPELNKFV